MNEKFSSVKHFTFKKHFLNVTLNVIQQFIITVMSLFVVFKQ